MGFKEILDGVRKNVREGLENLVESTSQDSKVNNAATVLRDKFFAADIAAEQAAEQKARNEAEDLAAEEAYQNSVIIKTEAEMDYEWINYNIDQLLEEMEYLANEAAKYEIKSSRNNTTKRTKELILEITETARNAEAETRKILKRISGLTDPKTRNKSQRVVLENLYSLVDSMVERLAINYDIAVNQAGSIKPRIGVRLADLKRFEEYRFAADMYEEAFYKKADEAQELEDKLPAVELILDLTKNVK